MIGEKVEFCKVGDAVYVLRPWPKMALIPSKPNADMLSDTVIVNGRVVTIGVKNGFASYGVQRTVGPDLLLCVAGENEFLGMPADVG